MSSFLLGDIEINDSIDVFILEDSTVYQKRMISCLKSIGFKGKVTVAGSLAEAHKLIATAKPGLILSDWNLPDGFGLDFLKMIRSERKFDEVPILMVTTEGEVGKILSAVSSGADGYVLKPFYEDDVIGKLSFAFEKRSPKEKSIFLELMPVPNLKA